MTYCTAPHCTALMALEAATNHQSIVCRRIVLQQQQQQQDSHAKRGAGMVHRQHHTITRCCWQTISQAANFDFLLIARYFNSLLLRQRCE